jgi:MtfA peptidase
MTSEEFGMTVTWIFGGGIALITLYLLWKVLFFGIETFLFFVFKKDFFKYFELYQRKLTMSEEAVLYKFSPYYKSLSSPKQRIFQSRLKKFMLQKTFETRKDLPLTEEMKVLIASSAVQLTFGLRQYLIAGFDRIIIYPQEYFSQITEQYHRGEVNTGGVIVLSWKDVKEGFIDSSNNYNLGLHEFAHALILSYSKNQTDDICLAMNFKNWKQVGAHEFNMIREGHASYLRKYGGQNLMEFFAVSVEHFFETPDEFKHKLPALYTATSSLLGQDPLDISFNL